MAPVTHGLHKSWLASAEQSSGCPLALTLLEVGVGFAWTAVIAFSQHPPKENYTASAKTDFSVTDSRVAAQLELFQD